MDFFEVHVAMPKVGAHLESAASKDDSIRFPCFVYLADALGQHDQFC